MVAKVEYQCWCRRRKNAAVVATAIDRESVTGLATALDRENATAVAAREIATGVGALDQGHAGGRNAAGRTASHVPHMQ